MRDGGGFDVIISLMLLIFISVFYYSGGMTKKANMVETRQEAIDENIWRRNQVEVSASGRETGKIDNAFEWRSGRITYYSDEKKMDDFYNEIMDDMYYFEASRERDEKRFLERGGEGWFVFGMNEIGEFYDRTGQFIKSAADIDLIKQSIKNAFNLGPEKDLDFHFEFNEKERLLVSEDQELLRQEFVEQYTKSIANELMKDFNQRMNTSCNLTPEIMEKAKNIMVSSEDPRHAFDYLNAQIVIGYDKAKTEYEENNNEYTAISNDQLSCDY